MMSVKLCPKYYQRIALYGTIIGNIRPQPNQYLAFLEIATNSGNVNGCTTITFSILDPVIESFVENSHQTPPLERIQITIGAMIAMCG